MSFTNVSRHASSTSGSRAQSPASALIVAESSSVVFATASATASGNRDRCAPIRMVFERGSITAIFCVLVDGDDLDDPVADTARGTLDGHIVLSRSLAEAGRFPAIDPLASLSRLAHVAFTREEAELSRHLRRLIARYEDTRDLRLLGAHKPGADPELDRAVELVPTIRDALLQTPADPPCKDAFSELAAVLAGRKGAQGSDEVQA